MGKQTSQLATMFWILKSRKRAGKPSFCTTRAYFLAASRDCSSLNTETGRQGGWQMVSSVLWVGLTACRLTDLLAPVQTIFPELKISAVVLGSRILMMTAANLWNNMRTESSTLQSEGNSSTQNFSNLWQHFNLLKNMNQLLKVCLKYNIQILQIWLADPHTCIMVIPHWSSGRLVNERLFTVYRLLSKMMYG